jgi:hypothetical protein
MSTSTIIISMGKLPVTSGYKSAAARGRKHCQARLLLLNVKKNALVAKNFKRAKVLFYTLFGVFF